MVKKDTKRFLKSDYKYSSKLVSKFINKVMLDGKKCVAEKIVYSSMDELAKSVSQEPLVAFKSAIENVTPKMEVKSRRVGGSTYQVPMEVSELRGVGHAMNWIIKFSRGRRGSL